MRGTAYQKAWEQMHIAKLMDVQTTSTCALCGWSMFGWLATVQEAYVAHRKAEHPEIVVKPKAKYRRVHGQFKSDKTLDENIAAARAIGAAGWAGAE